MTIEFGLLIEHSPPRGELATHSSGMSSNHPAFYAPGGILSPSANHPSALPSSFLKRASARKHRAEGQERCPQSSQVPGHFDEGQQFLKRASCSSSEESREKEEKLSELAEVQHWMR